MEFIFEWNGQKFIRGKAKNKKYLATPGLRRRYPCSSQKDNTALSEAVTEEEMWTGGHRKEGKMMGKRRKGMSNF